MLSLHRASGTIPCLSGRRTTVRPAEHVPAQLLHTDRALHFSGAPIAEGGSNYPLRGGKTCEEICYDRGVGRRSTTPPDPLRTTCYHVLPRAIANWEGGIKTPALVNGGLLPDSRRGQRE